MTPELQALTQRLEEVEKQIAHLGALVVEKSDTDQTVAARTVNAQKFVVSDANGVRRAELGMTVPAGRTEENAWLGLFDANGNVRACLGVEEDGLPWLEFYDASQKSVVNILVDAKGPRIGLFYGNGEPAAVISLDDGGPQMTLYGPNGEEGVHLLASAEDGPSILLMDKNGKPGVSISRWEGRPSVRLYDANGMPLLILKVSPTDGEANLYMGRAEGPSLKLAASSDGPYLILGKDNKVFWSAP